MRLHPGMRFLVMKKRSRIYVGKDALNKVKLPSVGDKIDGKLIGLSKMDKPAL